MGRGRGGATRIFVSAKSSQGALKELSHGIFSYFGL